MKKIFIIFFFILSACGYNPIYQSNQNYIFNKIELIGEKKLSRQIASTLSFKENKTDNKLNSISLEVKKSKVSTSKNTKGQITSYRMIIYLSLTIEKGDKKIKEKMFVKDFAYNAKDNKFDLSEYEKQIENNLLGQIIEEVNIFLSI